MYLFEDDKLLCNNPAASHRQESQMCDSAQVVQEKQCARHPSLKTDTAKLYMSKYDQTMRQFTLCSN